MLKATETILRLYDNDEFKVFIIQGYHGYGKSAYANRILSEIYGLRFLNVDNAVWDKKFFDTHLGYHPKEVKHIWDKSKGKDYVFHWDDAGAWLNKYKYRERYVQSIVEYLQTARTDFACIIMSCIDAGDLVAGIRELKGTIIIDITKEGCILTQNNMARYWRTANAYHICKNKMGSQWSEDDWADPFNCYMPDTFYNGYYQPRRTKYARIKKKQVKIDHI